MLRAHAFIATIAALALFAKPCFAHDLLIANATVFLPVVKTAKTAAATFTVENKGSASARILGISTPAAEAAQIHQTSEKDGVVHMEAVDVLEIPAGVKLDLSAEHMHIMLMGLRGVLHTGETVKLVLTTDNAETVEVAAAVREAASP